MKHFSDDCFEMYATEFPRATSRAMSEPSRANPWLGSWLGSPIGSPTYEPSQPLARLGSLVMLAELARLFANPACNSIIIFKFNFIIERISPKAIFVT